jgi:asparagine synthase (glutamine-hydrolysing)
MCGILGIYLNDDLPSSFSRATKLKGVYQDMLATLTKRGPDESTLVYLGKAVLGHTRLSIIDLSTGTQPIYNEDKSIAVILNGEIYNFVALRNYLETRGHIFRTHSDTEVIVHLYEEIGEDVFSKLNGMFAIIIYDSRQDKLICARDRLGEKPLIYWQGRDQYIFASELKAILKHPDVDKTISNEALAMYLNCMYVPAPLSIYHSIKKLQPAHYIVVDKNGMTIQRYWTPDLQIEWDSRPEQLRDRFLDIFYDAVNIRMVSDVPIGVFLSGGIDSSAVTAFIEPVSQSDSIKTFSVGFSDQIDERPFARLMAERYKTEHYELFINDNITDVFQNILTYFDEPFADSSAIPTYLISKEARKHVKVILTGDGGDELFAGYDSYLYQKYQLGHRIPNKIARELSQLSVHFLGKSYLERFLPKGEIAGAYRHWLWVRSIFTESEIKKLTASDLTNPLSFFAENRWCRFPNLDPLSQAFEHDINFYLPDDLLKKVDMASMFASLECRAPFLDYRLVEFALKIPGYLKLKNDSLKYILKHSLINHLPQPILNRSKCGFGLPVAAWLNGGLKDITRDLLSPGCKLEQSLSKDVLRDYIKKFHTAPLTTDDFRVSYRIWLFLILELWMREYS